LDDSIIHATIVQQDEPSDEESSVYFIFERLNTGGVTLVPQEIRAALYHGPFNDLIKHLNHNQAWRDLFGPINENMRDQELILRFLALLFYRDRYEWPLKTFLNKFMARNRDFKYQTADELSNAFDLAIVNVNAALGRRAFRPKGSFNAAVFDAVMVGLATRLTKGPIKDARRVAEIYNKLIEEPRFVEATETGTARPERVTTRMSLAVEAFATA
jgi:hypothetical protein